MVGTFKVWSELRDHRRSREVMMWMALPDGKEIAGKIEFTEDITDRLVETPTIAARRADGLTGQVFLQTILDYAWSIGMRPVGFEDTKNEVSALHEHLHDMRALVFNGKIEPKK